MKKFNTVEEQEAFDLGVDYTKAYIAFCLRHYVKNLLEGGTYNFQKDLLDFILGKSYIPNKDNVTFREFCENYEKYRLKL